MFWDIWPAVKVAIPDSSVRTEFTRPLLKLFYDWDVDPAEMRGGDPEIDRLVDEIDFPIDR